MSATIANGLKVEWFDNMEREVTDIPLIEVYRNTALVSDDWCRSWILSAQTALSRDFAPHWGDARLQWVGSGQAFTSGAWRLAWLDNSDVPDALGDHLTEDGLPIMQIFGRDTVANNSDLSVTGIHELWEGVADPFINKTVTVGNKVYAVEVSDAVEDDRFSYFCLGHRMSNFVFPNYYEPGSAGPWDFMGTVTAPLQIAAGGYLPVRVDGVWQQEFSDIRGPRQVKGPGSRTLRRFNAA